MQQATCIAAAINLARKWRLYALNACRPVGPSVEPSSPPDLATTNPSSSDRQTVISLIYLNYWQRHSAVDDHWRIVNIHQLDGIRYDWLQVSSGQRQRAFSYSSPVTLNAIPLSVRDAPSVSTFKRRLKPFYFNSLLSNLNIRHLATARASDSSYMLDYVARYKFLYVCMYVCKLQYYVNEGCKTCASLAGLLASFILVVIAFCCNF